ncbi:MAG: bacteriohemerythrin [Thermodesulfobacteriota bacterium]
MALAWTPDLAVGVNEIDEQHKELFKKIDNLHAAMSKGLGKEEITRTLKFLEDYVELHFGNEEKIMFAKKYPDYSSHKAQHEIYKRNIKSLKEELNTKGASIGLVLQINSSICDWIIKHIQEIDKALGKFLKQQVQGSVSA